MTVNPIIDQINEDIVTRQEGKIPAESFTGSMFRKLKRNKFIVYLRNEGSSIKPGDETISTDNFSVVYKPKEVQKSEEMKNQKKIDEYG